MRGFALFGVLLVNMYSFGGDSIAWDSAPDRFCYGLKHLLFESKSWTLFSVLFGLSFALQMDHWPPHRRLPQMLRRLLFLLGVGSLHALLYDGDILRLYAELGLLLLLIQRLPTTSLLAAAGCLFAVFPLAHAWQPDREPDDLYAVTSVADARDELVFAQEDSVYAQGTFAEVLAYNAEDLWENPLADVAWPDSGLTVLAWMLLGLCVARTNIVSDVTAHRTLWRRICVAGLLLGLAAAGGEAALRFSASYDPYRWNQASVPLTFVGDLLFGMSTGLLAAGYAAGLLLLCETARGRVYLAPLAAVGRLGLSVYLTQTVLFTTLFYGYGFAAAYRLGPAAITIAALAIFSVQVLACHWWLLRYRYGPAEWLWRVATGSVTVSRRG